MMEVAKRGDLEEVMSLYAECTKKMNENGLFNWDENYPDRKTILSNIASGSLFLLKEDVIKGVVCLDENQPAVYEGKDWELADNYICVHRLAISPSFQKQGLALRAMIEVVSWAKKVGYSHIRLDAFGENIGARNLYTKLGYKEMGMVHLHPDKDLEYMCFEKVIE